MDSTEKQGAGLSEDRKQVSGKTETEANRHEQKRTEANRNERKPKLMNGGGALGSHGIRLHGQGPKNRKWGSERSRR